MRSCNLRAGLLLSAVGIVHSARPRLMEAPFGSTPVLDGVLTPGEWDDAFSWQSISDFDEQFFPNLPGPPVDHDADIWVKHDDTRLYFAFNITDDVLYYYQTPEWMPTGNAGADNLTRQGWPWFGDELEILLNPSNTWSDLNQSVSGNGSSWQMVCNLHKSRMGGLGVPGLLEGEPRSSAAAWQTYQYWILNGYHQAAVGMTPGTAPGSNHYVIEWSIQFNPCIELSSGVFYNASMPATPVGLNLALGDVDFQNRSAGNEYGLFHEAWFNGTLGQHTNLWQFGTLTLLPKP